MSIIRKRPLARRPLPVANLDKLKGILWYTPESYPTAIKIMVDKKSFLPAYEQWRIGAERAVKSAQSIGICMVRIKFDPKKFRTWCRTNGRNFDAAARSGFADHCAKTGEDFCYPAQIQSEPHSDGE
jgi:hypothetical protein